MSQSSPAQHIVAPTAGGELHRSWQSLHPLDPPLPIELEVASKTAAHELTRQGKRGVKVTNAYLKEPPKNSVIEAIKFPGGPLKPATEPIKRQIEVIVLDRYESRAWEVVVTLPPSVPSPEIASIVLLPPQVQPALTPEEIIAAEEIVRNDPRCRAEGAKVGIKPEEMYADGWCIGYDTRWPGRRLMEGLMFARFDDYHDNHYSHPMDWFAVIDVNDAKVISIDYPSFRLDGPTITSRGTTAPPDGPEWDISESQQRERYAPPRLHNDWHPDRATAPDGKTPIEFRNDLKPLSVVQPEGVSFKRNGNVLEWQKWKLHVAFHPREGIVLSAISYKDDEAPGASKANPTERSLFWRVSMAEMVVPYAHPDYPHYKKFAFDVGEYGLGTVSNSLELGCDCVGEIEYMDGVVVGHDGTPQVIKNAICIHELDGGLGWKHTDFRPGGQGASVRQRMLEISSVYTVANYEYRVGWRLHMDGTLGCEVGLTGILNLNLLAPGEKATYAIEVMPQIQAQLHQHIFSVRIDPHLDGPRNSVVETHVERSPHPTGSRMNWAGNAFDIKRRLLTTSGDAVRDADLESERYWSIVNESHKHHASGYPVAYRFVAPGAQVKLWAAPDSIVARRAPFAKHHWYTLPYEEDRLYPAGKHVVQTTETPADSVTGWVGDGHDNVRDTDVIVFAQVGLTHIPRPEDAPVMPCDKVMFDLRPTGFFNRNPLLDVRPIPDKRSKLANADADCCKPKL